MKTNNSVAYQKAYSFANRIVKAYRYLTEQKREYVLSKQLLRSGTSVGAISQADFRNKVAIAYKEILESKVIVGSAAPFSQRQVPSGLRLAKRVGRLQPSWRLLYA